MDQPLILDRYRPLTELATGGFGEVTLAYDTRMQRRVAIKRLPFPHDRSGHPVTPAGLAEARTAALLNHPSIVTVYEWDTDDDEAFIIMEYVDGASLADLLDAYRGPLDDDEAAAVIEAVASALEFAHDNGVLHLDIKPENVLITRDGRVKVTDFGVATLSAASGHGPAVGGTLGYMPLEQLRTERVDERTDVWAFGALAFEILTNANPFVADSIEGAIFKAEIVEPPAAGEFEPSIPPAIDHILAAALETHRTDRYSGVTEFANRLLDHLGDASAGRESLADAIALHFAESDDSAGGGFDTLGLWDRLAPRSGAATRATAALLSAWLAWAGALPLGFGTAAAAAVAGLVALAAVLAPGLGTGLALLVLCAGIGAGASWPLAAALAAIGTAVWLAAGRRDSGVLAALVAPPLGVAHLAPTAPLLAGFALSPLRAALLGGFGATLTMLASAASGGEAPYLLVASRWLTDPIGLRAPDATISALLTSSAALAPIVAWGLAAAAMSLACRRASRPAAVLGAFLGTAALYGGYALADAIARLGNTSATWSGQSLLPHVTASLILIVLVIAAGPPVRGEEE
ncbi:MAG: serine/threonine-protein kinase [Actinomycetota bacterium]|nr:serine/threonine-protein kinase [Actinomycetota bacterium]